MTARGAAAALLLVAASSAHAEPRPITLDQAVALAVAHSPELAQTRAAAAGAAARVDSARARRLPSLRVDAHAELYPEPYQIDFGGAPFTLHDQTTSMTQVRVAQPLTGLIGLSRQVTAARHDAQAARADVTRAQLDSAHATAEAFVRVLAADAAADVAHQSVAQLTADRERARLLRAADSLTDVDVLRLEAAVAAATQAAVRADAARAVARAQLAIGLGLPGDAELAPVDDLPATPPPVPRPLAELLAQAAARPERALARELEAAAAARVGAARDQYLPDLRAIAAYTHTTGIEPFQPTNEEFVGLQLGWTAWDWGATAAGVREAEQARRKIAAGVAQLDDRIALEVRRRWLEAQAGHDSLAAAATQLAATEEAYRLQQVRFAAAAATTTDVLDAEAEVARARLQAALARDDYFLARLALERAIGEAPTLR